MKEIEKLLAVDWGGHGPESKMFVLRFLRRHGHGPHRQALRSMAKDLGLTEWAVIHALKELTQTGFMLRTAAPTGRGAGRHISAYQAGPALLRCLEAAAELSGVSRYAGVIQRVLGIEEARGKSPLVVSRVVGQLDVANRMLLATLLAHADEAGVVRGKGMAELGRLTGMTPNRIRQQTEKLLRLGYLRHIVSGVTGSALFGKAAGAYFLSLQHPDYEGAGVGGVLHTFTWEVHDGRGLEAAQLYALARGADLKAGGRIWGRLPADDGRWLLSVHPALLVRVAPLLLGAGSGGREAYLQMLIERYASYLLTRYWGRLPTLEEGIGGLEDVRLSKQLGKFQDAPAREFGLLGDKALLGMMEADLLARRVRAGVRQRRPPTDAEVLLVNLVYQIARALAKRAQAVLQRMLPSHEWGKGQGVLFTTIPGNPKYTFQFFLGPGSISSLVGGASPLEP